MNKVIKLLFVTMILLYLIPNIPLYAATWYVRPAIGEYGSEDGTSYEDAWDGLLNVVWGAGGVDAGDTLYVCGLHVYDLDVITGIVSQADITPVSGTSESARVTIRGDYPGDPGIVWGAYRMSHDNWTDEGDGVWSIPLRGDSWGDWYFQDVGDPTNEDFVVLDKAENLSELNATPGSHYSATYQGLTPLYVKLTDGGDPTGRVYANRWGYDWVISGLEYITFLNLKFYAPDYFLWGEPANHIRWEGCTLAYGKHSLLTFTDNSDYMEVINCDISWASNGIYTISPGNNAPSNYLFSGNYIHDIGVREFNQNTDAHAIGIQGGHNGLIEKNYIVNTGNAVLFHTWVDQELTNTIVRYNYIKDTHNLGGVLGKGIHFQTHNACIANRTGNEIYGNIVENAFRGYVYSFTRDLVKLYNNLAINCRDSSFMFIGGSQVIDFDSGTTKFTRDEGFDIVTQDSGASAEIADISQQTGSSPNIKGTISLIPHTIVGSFVDNEALKVNGVTYAFADGTNYLLVPNIEMRNSISFNPDDLHIWSCLSNYNESLISEYNLFWPDSRTMFDDVFGGDPVNFAGWQAKGWDIVGSAAVDPLFIDALTGDFRLQADSPAIDAGVDVGLSKDFDGNPVPYGDAPDIGAYEYGSALLKYDVNGDGYVNIQDVQACINHISGTQDWGEKADVNRDGKTDKLDVQEIINIMLRD